MFNFGKKENDQPSETKQEDSGHGRPILRLLAAAYLVYTSINLFKGIKEDGLGRSNWIFLVFAILFLLVAVWFVLLALKQFKVMKEKSDREMEEILEEEREDEYRRAHGLPTLEEERIFREMDEAEAKAEETEEDSADESDEE